MQVKKPALRHSVEEVVEGILLELMDALGEVKVDGNLVLSR